MARHQELLDFYSAYGERSFGQDEPAYAEICAELGNHPEVVGLLAAHPREAQQPNLILAAVHYVLLGGLDHGLAQVYDGTSAAAPTPLFADLVLANRAEIDHLLTTKRTQTNEVGRCSVLALLLNQVSAATGQAVAWIDLGASAGLNLHLDRYRMHYQFDGRAESTGPTDSPLALTCDVLAGSPVIEPQVQVGWRLGVDRSPIDVSDPDQVRWLQACLWPSKTERRARLDAAVQIAAEHPVEIIAADAVAGLATAIDRAPSNAPLVITTSWVWYYLPRDVQAQVLDVMRSANRELWWFSLEGAGVVAELDEQRDRHSVTSTIGKLKIAADGTEVAEVLGTCHPHGSSIDVSAGLL